MPTYDYACKGCGHRFETFQSMTAKPLKKCPKCAANKLQRQIGSGGGIIFKGSGFYATDYRKKSGIPTKETSKDSSKDSSKNSACGKSACKPGDGKASCANG